MTEPDDAHGRAALLAGEHEQDHREHHGHGPCRVQAACSTRPRKEARQNPGARAASQAARP